MIITVAQQKEMAWNNIECQIANGMDPEIAKVLAKIQFEYNF